jgi:hypothetical protein
MLEMVAVVRDVLREGVSSGEFRPLDPVLTHLTIVGALIFLNATAPIRERAEELDADFDFPEPSVDVAAFLNDMLLDGVTATGSKAPR